MNSISELIQLESGLKMVQASRNQSDLSKLQKLITLNSVFLEIFCINQSEEFMIGMFSVPHLNAIFPETPSINTVVSTINTSGLYC